MKGAAVMIEEDKISEVLEAIVEPENFDRLEKKTQDFIASIKDFYERTGYLTEAQNERLDQIWCQLP